MRSRTTHSPASIAWILLILPGLILPGCSSGSDLTANTPDLYFPVNSEDGYGIMNCSGQWLLEPVGRTDGIISGQMVNGLAPFINIGEGYETFINREGEFPYDNYDHVMPFSEGLAAVQVDGKWGFIDTTGKYVIQPQFPGTLVGYFHDGLANVATEATTFGISRNWIFINKKGDQVLGPYSWADPFSDGYAAVSGYGEDHLSGFIDTNGDFVLQFTQESGYSPAGNYGDELFPVHDLRKQFEEGVCAVGFMNKKAEWVIDPEYCIVGTFRDGLAPVSSTLDITLSEYGYINTSGRLVIEEQYQFVSEFSGGCARVAWNGFNSIGLIDTRGNFIYKYEAGK